jgi:hypothetical protein
MTSRVRKQRKPLTDELRSQRSAQHARERIQRDAAESKELDAAVRESIKLFGA